MLSFIPGALTAIAIAGAAVTAAPGADGPYAWDANGACRNAAGAVVTETLCPPRPKTTACHDARTGKPESCEVKGAVRDQP